MYSCSLKTESSAQITRTKLEKYKIVNFFMFTQMEET